MAVDRVGDERHPQLIRSDAWLLASLTESLGRWKRLDQILENGDWLNTSILTFHEISYGLPRLVAAGYAEVSKGKDGLMRAAATDRCKPVRARVNRYAKTRADALEMFEAELGCLAYPQHAAEDLSLGALPGFEVTEYNTALADYRGLWTDPFGLKRAYRRVLRRT